MLVLSRRPEESIVLPSLGVRLRVIKVQGNAVRIGIEAPDSVPIVRAELAQQAAAPLAPKASEPLRPHAVRNRLNKITLAIHLARQQLQAGEPSQADLTLEKALGAMESLEQQWVGERPPAQPKQPAPRCRTLLVEDDQNERELLAGLLNLGGFQCDAAIDGQAALEYLASHERPDFLILDMRMPRLGGPATLQKIRHDPRLRGMKVFVVSGSTPAECGLEAGPEGVDGWFTKPLNPGRLWEAMNKSLAQGVN